MTNNPEFSSGPPSQQQDEKAPQHVRDDSPNHVAAALPPPAGKVNPYWVAVFALGLGSQGLFGNSSLTAYTSSSTFPAIVSIGLTSTDTSPLEFQQLKWLYHAAFGNVTADKVHGLMVNGLHHENKFGFQVHSYATLLSITVLIVLLRIWAKYVLAGKLRLDDWLLVVGFLLDLGPIIWYITVLSQEGGIQHVWDVPYSQVITTARTGFIGQVLQIPSIYLIKLSFLVFYRTLSPGRKNNLVCLLTAVAISIGSIILVFMSIFQCNPVQDYWENLLTAKCMSRGNLVAATSIFYMVSDFIILIIPVIVSKLNLPINKKVSVYAMFFLGLLTCVFSAIRVRKSINNVMGIDVTWQQYEFGIWSQLEVDMGVIVSCLPAIRALFVHATEGKNLTWSGHAKEIISTIASGKRTGSDGNTTKRSSRRLTAEWKGGDEQHGANTDETVSERVRRSSGGEEVRLDELIMSADERIQDEEQRGCVNYTLTAASSTDEGDSDIVESVRDRYGDEESNDSSSRRPSGLSPRPSTPCANSRG